jgi:hypothetical protein
MLPAAGQRICVGNWELTYQVANTNGEAWKWKHVRRKTDRDDALKLARLVALGELPHVQLPETQAKRRRPLVCPSIRKAPRIVLELFDENPSCESMAALSVRGGLGRS